MLLQFSVPVYFFQKILSLLGVENLDLVVGNKIDDALWCRTPLCRGCGGFLLNAVFLGLVAGVTTFSLNVFLGSTSCETMRCSGRSSQGCIEPSGCLGAHGETHRSGYLQPFCSHWCQVLCWKQVVCIFAGSAEKTDLSLCCHLQASLMPSPSGCPAACRGEWYNDWYTCMRAESQTFKPWVYVCFVGLWGPCAAAWSYLSLVPAY